MPDLPPAAPSDGSDLRRAETLPAPDYHDPGIFEHERRTVFGREWILVAHEAELARPGDAVAERLAGWPLFVRRGRDGVLRGFHDVCRHRAGPIVGSADEGVTRRCPVPKLRCRYHGWLYDESGRLERTPDFGEALDFEPGRLALPSIQVASWRGFVFACLDADAPALEESLGRLPALAADVPLERYRLDGRAQHVLRCNWKAYVENYLEGYHIPYIHPRLHREVDVKGYEVRAADRVVTHHAPSRPRVAEPVYDGLWAWLWPNVAFNVYGDGLSVERMLPLTPTTMRIDYLFLFAEGADREAALAMCEEVTDEDRRICESVQHNLEAGLYDRGRLSPRHEAGVHYFQQQVRAARGRA
ncbi:MAG: SRPBCC family protein [Myxococcota bacterium]|nr:SRPBCC family protein [Myxococcota bacterium]